MKKLVFYSVIVFVLLLAACSEKPEPAANDDTNTTEAKETNQITLAIGEEPEQGFDPTTGWGRYGSPLFQSTLLSENADLEVTLDLATDYQVSTDGKKWTVMLRDDAVFSDGEPLTADDVVFTYETAKQAQSVVDVANLEKVEKNSEHEVSFYLKEPQSTFIHTLQTLGIVPEHAYDSNYAEKPVGSGPYKIVEWRKGEQLIVERNPHYYGEQPAFEQLTFLFMGEDQAIAAAKAGEVDVLSVPITSADQSIDGMNRISLESVDNRGVMLPYPEPTTNEEEEKVGNAVTSSLAIRQAMNYAVNREEMVDGVLNGEGTVAFSSVDGLPWGSDKAVIEDNNQAKAEQILKDAGWERGDDHIFEKDGQRASLPLYYPSGDQMRQSLSMVFADQMNDFGIEITTKSSSWNEIETQMHANPVMMGWGSHNPIELYSLYHSSMQGIDYYNANYYHNEKVDSYLDQALNAKTENEANEYWKLAQWDGSTGLSAVGDAPWVWLVNLNHIYYINDHIEMDDQKVQPHGHGWPITDFITEWQWQD
ncbi:ABC transporter substrate-binding protein [Gracilibacillus salinarum]|uniref:ABC transporter substrate-binding protein n=1 Tax=Gracilibacillus salinarum TaxID=2932255 RepID=A0ABY4GKV8_9BACI|nr:ABC transporter substrate-binding protein [Gracilibacillus salinarum]UOQ85000.1 ABC transporter substrate-binding protein [Gracilibacillus salinarum]